jgi:hypothetical protein
MSIVSSSTPVTVRLLAVALLCGGPLLLIAASNPSPPPVYSEAAVQMNIIRSPGAWIGRTVRVRALVGNSCATWMGGANPACISWQPALLDPSAPSAASALPLVGAPQPPLLAALRQLPLVGGLVQSPQRIRWGALTTYRVRLSVAPTTLCGAVRCYEALLLDAAPSSLEE